MTAALFEAIDGTWPPARIERRGVLTLREGQGGGSRVSATTVEGAFTEADLDTAEAEMRAMGQRAIFQLRPGQEALDAALAARGYEVLDPVTLYTCPPERLCDVAIPRVTVLHISDPLAIMREIWAAGGIGAERLAVMARAKGPKTYMLGRLNEKPGGVAYAAIHDGIAMVHAVEVVPGQRRGGMGRWFMRSAAFWARDNGARLLSVMCTDANGPANGLYSSLGMDVAGHYHYRLKTGE